MSERERWEVVPTTDNAYKFFVTKYSWGICTFHHGYRTLKEVSDVLRVHGAENVHYLFT